MNRAQKPGQRRKLTFFHQALTTIIVERLFHHRAMITLVRGKHVQMDEQVVVVITTCFKVSADTLPFWMNCGIII